tara:strand:+ start:6581 stop:6691 length:111 start_codon:yes stop_codon:yes gene_type:complete
MNLKYYQAYNVLMDYFNQLDHESRKEVDEKLNQIGL